MSVNTAIPVRRRRTAAKVETSTGSPIALTTGDCGFNMYDPKIVRSNSPTQRQKEGSSSNLPPVVGAEQGKFTGRTHVYNAVSPPQWLSVLLLGCGLQSLSGGVYAPLTGPSTTLTVGHNQAGTLKSISGAMGNAKFSAESGKVMTVEWEFDGLWQPPSATAILVPTDTNIQTPRFAGATITVGGVPYPVGKFEFDLGNKLVMRLDAANSTGYRAAFIADRVPMIKIDPESVPLATEDWHAAQAAGTTFAFVCTIGTGSNNQITFAAPALALNSPPQDGEREGIRTDELEFLCTSTTDDAEYTITAA